MRRFLLGLVGVALAAGVVRSAPPVLPFAEVQSGMRGTGRTVFGGTTVETFDVEILGKLPNVGPDQNLILARCSGGPLAETGVLAGMSGSPVVVDGRLVGAVAYSWGFAKDAIAGITPIEEMLRITELQTGGRAYRHGLPRLSAEALATLQRPQRIAPFFEGRVRALLRDTGALMPVSLPLSVSGMNGFGLARLQQDLNPAGLLPIQAGGSGSAAATPPPLEPGSAMGLKLVSGDVEMTATGTVTWIDDDRVLAFGHPLFGLGDVDLPLTGASVQALLPSLAQSAKIATPLGEVGALRQDRSAGVLGRLGVTPRLIPVRLQLTGAAGAERAYAFEIADDPLLSPLLLYVTLNGVLASSERVFGSATVRLDEGSVIKLGRGDDVDLDNVFAGPTAFLYGTGIPAYILHLLMNNTWSPPQIAGINLILRLEDAPRTGTIERASLSRYRVRAGDEVTATVVVQPYRGPEQVHTRTLRVPDDTPPGTLTLFVGAAQAAGRDEEASEHAIPRSLDQLVTLINHLRRNDHIYLLATQEDSGVLLDGARLPNLPPSISRVLSRPRSRGNFAVVPRRGLLEESIPTEFAVEGVARLALEVER